MAIYILNTIFVYLNSCLAVCGRKSHKAVMDKPLWLFVGISLLSLILVPALRYKVGTDYSTYYGLIGYYYTLPFHEIFHHGDWGFILLSRCVGSFTHEPQITFVVCAVLTISLIVITLREYARPFELAMFLYIGTFTYYSSFNGVRQWLASALLFWTLRYLVKGLTLRYMVVVLLAATIHLSALIMVPVYFLVRKESWRWILPLLLVVTLVAYFCYSASLSTVMSILEGTQYGHYNNILYNTQNGANFIRVAVWMVPVGFYLLYRRRFEERWPGVKHAARLSIIGLMFAVLATRNATIYRWCFYFEVYNLLLIPEIFNITVPRSKALVYITIMACYFLYSFLLLPHDSNLLPYQVFNFASI